MTHPHPTDGRHAPHLFDEIQSLLVPLRDMQRRHQEQLDAHRDADGEVIEDQYPQYEDTRLATATEASDMLDTLGQRLEGLVADPPRRAFTLAVRSPGHREGARTTLFVTNGTDINNAHHALIQLPSFQLWLEDVRAPDGPGDGEGDLVPGESHAGIRAPGSYADLRREQAGILADRSSATGPALPPPSSAAPRRSR